MATFSISNFNSNTVLEFGMTTWNESFIPHLSVNIRKFSSSKSEAMCMIGVDKLLDLAENFKDPNSYPQLQITNKNGTTTVGRVGNDFGVQNNYGSSSINLTVLQWNSAITYVIQMSEWTPLIREISKTVRMQVLNIMRQLKLDKVVNGRFLTTPWYDVNMEDPAKYISENNSYRTEGNQYNKNKLLSEGVTGNEMRTGYRNTNRQVSGGLNNSPNPVNTPHIGMPNGIQMPPQMPPMPNTQQVTQPTANQDLNPVPGTGINPGNIMGNSLPNLPNDRSALTEGMRNAYDSMF